MLPSTPGLATLPLVYFPQPESPPLCLACWLAWGSSDLAPRTAGRLGPKKREVVAQGTLAGKAAGGGTRKQHCEPAAQLLETVTQISLYLELADAPYTVLPSQFHADKGCLQKRGMKP